MSEKSETDTEQLRGDGADQRTEAVLPLGTFRDLFGDPRAFILPKLPSASLTGG